jgi:hypothetical protein
MFAMTTKKHPSTLGSIARDPKTGRMIPAGYGALKDQYVVRKGVDVTKPIFEQVCRTSRGKVASKRHSKG